MCIDFHLCMDFEITLHTYVSHWNSMLHQNPGLYLKGQGLQMLFYIEVCSAWSITLSSEDEFLNNCINIILLRQCVKPKPRHGLQKLFYMHVSVLMVVASP